MLRAQSIFRYRFLLPPILLLLFLSRVATFHFSQFDKLAIMTATTLIAAPFPIGHNDLRGDIRENQVYQRTTDPKKSNNFAVNILIL